MKQILVSILNVKYSLRRPYKDLGKIEYECEFEELFSKEIGWDLWDKYFFGKNGKNT